MRQVKPPVTIPSKNITKINFSGLKGRIAHFDSRTNSKQKIVVVSGHHSSHERMLSFADFLQDYGEVYMVDLPGFGGMDSFKKIGKDISYDSYAEYLYTILKSQKLTNDVVIFSVSVGTQFVTRMFQMYPESQKWTRHFIGFVGFGAAKDFQLKPFFKLFYSFLAFLGSNRITLFMMKVLAFNRVSLRAAMTVLSKFKRKMKTDSEEMRQKFIQMEVNLWLINDYHTQAITTKMMFNQDLRTMSEELIDVPMSNVLTKEDQYFNSKEINKTLRDLFKSYKPFYIELGMHMPSMVSDKSEVARLFDQSMIDEIMGVKGKS